MSYHPKPGDVVARSTRPHDHITVGPMGTTLFLGTNDEGKEYAYYIEPQPWQDWHWVKVPDPLPEVWIIWFPTGPQEEGRTRSVTRGRKPDGIDRNAALAIAHIASDGTLTWEKRR